MATDADGLRVLGLDSMTSFKRTYDFKKSFDRKYDEWQVVREGNMQVFLRLLPSLNINQTRWSGWTLLHRAAESGQTDICEVLLINGARVNQKTVWGWYTPLHCALGNGWRETALLLIEYGALTSIEDKEGNDCFKYATKKGFKDLALALETELQKKKATENMKAKMNKMFKSPVKLGSFSKKSTDEDENTTSQIERTTETTSTSN